MTALQQLDPLYHFSTHFPDRLSLIDSGLITKSPERKLKQSSASRRKNNPRYKTQPITFDEIKEVEEPVTTPSEEKTTNSFLSKLQESKTKADNRLHPASYAVKVEVIEVDSPSSDLWYETQYPTKLSFLDVPENTHHSRPVSKSPCEKKSNKGRLNRRRNNPRYKTQPITFDEIKEVEEPDQSSTPTNENPNSMDILFNANSDTQKGDSK